MKKVTYPCEYICFYPMEFPTQQGDAFVFIDVDVYSKFLFNTGLETNRDNDTVLKHVKLLMDNKDFKKQSNRPFTLVFHKYENLRSQITDIIRPLGGTMIVDDEFVAKEMSPIIEQLYKSISQKKK